MNSLKDKVAVVVGAGTTGNGMGNGKAVALAMARAGARVVAVDIDAAAVEETRDLVRAGGGVCTAFVGDMTESEPVTALFEETHDRFGRLDILHNNIGVFETGGPVELEEATWDRVIRTNLRPLFLTCKHALTRMVAGGGGSIINVGSISGVRYMGVPQIAYATTKSAMIAFTRSVAAQYGPQGVRANTLMPGIIESPMLLRAAEREYARKYWSNSLIEARKAREQHIPLRTYGGVEDVASAAVFLASDDARYITGTELIVDGGVTALAPA